MSRWSDRCRFGLTATAASALLSLAPVCSSPAAADPELADGPVPGLPITVRDGDRFAVNAIAFAVQDSRGIARVESSPSGTRVRLDATVLFTRDSAALDPSAVGRLVEVADQLRDQARSGSLTVTGYTDDLGSAAHGLRLSRARAAAVAATLREVLPSGRYPIRVLGRGEADPQVPNDSEAHRRLNRRVLISFQP